MFTLVQIQLNIWHLVFQIEFFFATNESVLTTASRETLRKQAAWLRKNSKITIVLEGHADERGTRSIT